MAWQEIFQTCCVVAEKLFLVRMDGNLYLVKKVEFFLLVGVD
jgi:hypothetical protein